ncbi:response regulator [Pontibacillus yanchengensis]|nr:response regulator [Pontibacillus yanchengensis]
MYKLLIVDDEKVVLDALETIIDWEDYNIELVGSASNGNEALACIKELSPDIVLTDIRMPGRNGLELVEASRAFSEDVLFIIISAYSEFQYAKKAIELEAIDYLVKPIEIDDIVEAISKAVEKKERNLKQQRLGSQLEQYQGELEEKYLLDCMLGGKVDQMERPVPFTSYAILCLGGKGESSFTDHVVDRSKHLETIMRQSFSESVYVVHTYIIEEKIILFLGSSTTNSLDHEALEAFYATFQKEIGMTPIAGISDTYKDFAQVHQAYLQAKQAFKIGYFFDQAITHHHEHEQVNQKIGESILHKIEDAVGMEDFTVQALFPLVDDVIAYISAHNLPPEKSKYVCYTCISSIYTQVQSEFGVNVTDINGEDTLLYVKLNELQSLEAIQAWLTNHLHRIDAYLKAHKGSYHDRLIQEVKHFIEKHYNEPLELNELADHFHMSSAYLSSLFSKKMGVTIFDYMTSIRMNQAKEMLRSTNYKINEICQVIGYDNQRYFNQVFKKKVGTTPGKYRTERMVKMPD